MADQAKGYWIVTALLCALAILAVIQGDGKALTAILAVLLAMWVRPPAASSAGVTPSRAASSRGPSGRPVQGEVQRDRRVGRDYALDRGMRDVALVPQRDVLQRRRHHAAHEAGEAGDVLRQHGIALVRHGGGALLALG